MGPMIEIDADQALELLEKVVNKLGPDYVYPNAGSDCRYADLIVHEDTDTVGPDVTYGCMVGYAYGILGIPADRLRPMEGSLRTLWRDEQDVEYTGVKLTEDAMRVWQAAQESQDDGNEFGKALAEAKAEAKRIAAIKKANA